MKLTPEQQRRLDEWMAATSHDLKAAAAAFEKMGATMRAAAIRAGDEARKAALFRSRVASIMNLDLHELVAATVIVGNREERERSWASLQADPLRWFLRLDDRRLEALWGLIEKRNAPAVEEQTKASTEDRGASLSSLVLNEAIPALEATGCNVSLVADLKSALSAMPRQPSPQPNVRALPASDDDLCKLAEQFGASICWPLDCEFHHVIEITAVDLRKMLSSPSPQPNVAVSYTQAECDEMCEIAERDGYEKAVQEIDQLTGGDGEYRVSMLIGGGVDDERHTPDAPAMIQRIVDRFETLNLLHDAEKSGRDQEWGMTPSQHLRGEWESREGCVGPMTASRATYFLERFKHEEKMLGPHEQWALDFAIAALATTEGK